MAEFPTTPEQITAEWLSGVTGRDVRNVDWEPIGTGQVGDSIRLTCTDNGSGDPFTLAAKLPAADETSRQTAAMMSLYAKEVLFYRDIAPHLSARIPEVHFSDIDDTGAAFILLFEDLGPARGGDQIAGCDLSDAEHAIGQAAAFHAPSWENARLLSHNDLQMAPEKRALYAGLYPQAHATWRERYDGILEPEYMELCDRIAAMAAQIMTREVDARCVVHGDFRLDNMLFGIKGGAEPIAILDWQTVTLGHPMTDIGYFLGCGIGDTLRRKHEDHLMELYLAEMAKRGVTLTREDTWDDYRRGALHGVMTAVFSAAFVERTERGDANFLLMARGACALALEHDSLGAITETT